jgi:hypothetical protein
MSQDSWENVAVLGALIVVAGVALEGIDWFSKFRKRNRRESILAKEPSWTLAVEFFSITLVVMGLCVEIFATYEASLKAREKIKQLTAESKTASDNAASATKDAGDSKVLAAKIGTTNAQLVATNLWLQAKLQPRIITMEQTTNFIFLTEKIQKFPIRVRVASADVMGYAIQIRQMLNLAGYKVPDSDTNNNYGIVFDPTTFSQPSKASESLDVNFFSDITNGLGSHPFTREVTNGFSRPIILGETAEDTNKTFAALGYIFNQIGINNGQGFGKDLAAPNRFGVFIGPKFQ